MFISIFVSSGLIIRCVRLHTYGKMESQPSTSSGTKRKRKVLTSEEKLEIIEQLKKGATAVALSVQYDVPRTTINDFKKNMDEIEKFASQMERLDSHSKKKRKTMKKATNDTLDYALYLWFTQKRSEGIPLSGPIIAEKALHFNAQLNGDASFRASSGWLEKFKLRHGIRQLNIEGEKMSAASDEIISEFKDTFLKMIAENGFTRDQVYNADKTGLNFKALPTKTLASYSEKYAPGFKMQKQRITAMCCANASGMDRIPLLLIGTARKPRCFKSINMATLPVHYYAQTSSWMTQAIFTDWFKKVFVPHVQAELKSKNLPPKAVLILNNAPSHPNDELKSDDGNIFCFFLPPNATPIIQPMDQSVIETMKRLYRKRFIHQLVMDNDEMSIIAFWKEYNLKHVVNNVSDAWNDVSYQTLQRAWNKLWPLPAESTEPESVEVIDDQFLAETSAAFSLENNEFIEWLNIDQHEMGYQLMTDDEIIEIAKESDEAATDSETDAYDGGYVGNVSQKDQRKEAKDAMVNIGKFIEWYEQQQDSNRTDAMILRRMRSFAQIKSESTVKQSKLTEFFETS